MKDTPATQIEEYFPRALLTRFGGTIAEAAAAATEAVERYVSALEGLEPGLLHRPVAPGKWSPVGFTEHLYLVTLIYRDDISRVTNGGEPSRHGKGSVDGAGNLVVTVPGAVPESDRHVAEVVADLRAATASLVETARGAGDAGFGSALVHVNPYFGELTPLGCLQLAATHAHHHRKRHLLKATG